MVKAALVAIKWRMNAHPEVQERSVSHEAVAVWYAAPVDEPFESFDCSTVNPLVFGCGISFTPITFSPGWHTGTLLLGAIVEDRALPTTGLGEPGEYLFRVYR